LHPPDSSATKWSLSTSFSPLLFDHFDRHIECLTLEFGQMVVRSPYLVEPFPSAALISDYRSVLLTPPKNHFGCGSGRIERLNKKWEIIVIAVELSLLSVAVGHWQRLSLTR
jgi:hypothetical protein